MNRTAVEDIKTRLPIEEVVGQYVKLEKAGKSYKARCPFHNEKTPSFFVSPDRGGYYCFGCGAKGDIFSFVEQFEGLDFRGALKILAERAGVQLTYEPKADGERDRLFQIMEQSAEFFESQYTKSKEAQDYVKGRGVSERTREEFRIGFVPEGWQNLIDFLRKQKWPDALIEKAGLGKKTEEGKFYDRFRGRVMFPITDSSGRVVAFTGRILPRLDDGKAAKYLNSPDMPLYDKSMVLYGLDKAKPEIRRLNYAIMVEGQMDLVMSYQAGVKNIVAASGTALTDESFGENGVISNLGLVRRLSPNLIIAFDSDAAGRKAAMRAAGIALSMGMDVKIADLAGGKDPAELVKDDPESWKGSLRGAKPVVEFELGNVLRDSPDPRKSPRALRQRVFPFLARIESEMDKAHFVKMIAERAKTSEEAVWQDLRAYEATAREQRNREEGIASASDSSRSNVIHDGLGRLPLVERRMFGLLRLMDADHFPSADEYRERIRTVSGASYDDRIRLIDPLVSDIAFEAEALFGSEPERWDAHMKELILNFEEDLIGDELIRTMHDLRAAEKDGKTDIVSELARKCLDLSRRKAEVGRKRRS